MVEIVHWGRYVRSWDMSIDWKVKQSPPLLSLTVADEDEDAAASCSCDKEEGVLMNSADCEERDKKESFDDVSGRNSDSMMAQRNYLR